MTDTAAIPASSALAHKGGGKIVMVALKIGITGGCFWYLSRKIDTASVVSGLAIMDLRWAGLASLLLMLEMPLVAMRWRAVVNEIAETGWRAPRGPMIIIVAIASFFSQVLPSIAGEGVRSWLLARLGCGWRISISSVVIDRAFAVGLLFGLTILILLMPSSLSELGGFRSLVVGIYGACILAAAIFVVFLPMIIPLLERHRYFRWAATLMACVRRVLFSRAASSVLGLGLLVHALTIVAIWCILRAQGLALPISDAAVLFAVVLGVAMVPISIGGWGVRELTVVTLLGQHGMAPEQALLFSVSFGVVLALSSLPGGVAWLFYTSPSIQPPAEVR
jgi:glycosyltransferase 2 family protein